MNLASESQYIPQLVSSRPEWLSVVLMLESCCGSCLRPEWLHMQRWWVLPRRPRQLAVPGEPLDRLRLIRSTIPVTTNTMPTINIGTASASHPAG